MLDIRANSVVYTIGKHLLSPSVATYFSKGICTTRGLVFSFDVSIFDPAQRTDGSARGREGIHILVAGNHYAFAAVGQLMWDHTTEWTNLSNHNSCWTTAIEDYLTSRYFALCAVANDKKAPRDLEQQSWFSAFRPFTMVEVELGRDEVRGDHWLQVNRINAITKEQFAAYK